MSAFVSLLFAILLACDFTATYGQYNCRWRTVGDALSLIVNDCLRLSIYSCDCTGPGCPGKYYKVERTNEPCPAVITWCAWAPWNVDIQTSHTSPTSCQRVSSRKRECCIKGKDRTTPTHSNLKYWACPTSIQGDKQALKMVVACPSRGNNLSVVFISLIVCLFFITVIIVIVRIFCYKRISAYFHRNNTSGVAPHRSQHQSHNPYLHQAEPQPYASQINNPPTYTEAMDQIPKLPSYDEVIRSDPNIAEHCSSNTPPETVTSTSQNQNNGDIPTSDSNDDNRSSSRREENMTDAQHGSGTSC